MSSPLSNSAPRNTPRMTYATEASFIIQDEFMTRARAKAATLADDELRELVRVIIDDERKYFTDADLEVPDYVPDPDRLSRDEMIERLVHDAGGAPCTEAIPADADDPLVLDAQELRREQWEEHVAAAIKQMGLTGLAAERHRAAAEEAELSYLRRLAAEIWSMSEADLRVQALDLVAKLAGGTEGDKKFRHDPNKMSRGYLLAAIAGHISWLTWSPELRRATSLAAE